MWGDAHAPLLRPLHDPQPLVPDTTVPPGQGGVSSRRGSSSVAVPSHQKGIRGKAGAFEESQKGRPNAELGERSGETLGPGRYRRKAAKGGELLLSVGAVRPPLGFGSRAMVPARPGTPGPSKMRWTKPLVNQELLWRG